MKKLPNNGVSLSEPCEGVKCLHEYTFYPTQQANLLPELIKAVEAVGKHELSAEKIKILGCASINNAFPDLTTSQQGIATDLVKLIHRLGRNYAQVVLSEVLLTYPRQTPDVFTNGDVTDLPAFINDVSDSFVKDAIDSIVELLQPQPENKE